MLRHTPEYSLSDGYNVFDSETQDNYPDDLVLKRTGTRLIVTGLTGYLAGTEERGTFLASLRAALREGGPFARSERRFPRPSPHYRRRELRSAATRTEVHAMRTFLVTFHKVVPDGRGRDHHILQRQAVVSACSGDAAADAAKALFCQAAGIADWRLRADTFEVVGLTDLAS